MTLRIQVSFVILLAAFPVRAEEPESQAVYETTLKASAWIVVPGRPASKQGTGFVVDRTRHWVITNEHVVGQASTLQVFFPKKKAGGLVTDRKGYLQSESIRGRVLATDPVH